MEVRNMGLKENLKGKRIELDLTLEEVASKVGIGRSTLHKYENGTIPNIPSERIESLAAALGTTPARLMGWDTTEDTIISKELLMSKEALASIKNFSTNVDSKTGITMMDIFNKLVSDIEFMKSVDLLLTYKTRTENEWEEMEAAFYKLSSEEKHKLKVDTLKNFSLDRIMERMRTAVMNTINADIKGYYDIKTEEEELKISIRQGNTSIFHEG
jgi:transcriptional regulator with XRE-family HTH domain